MNIEEDLHKLIHQLIHKECGNIAVNGSDIAVHVFEQDSKISLSTPVYYGGNYIPKSVRNCLKQQPLGVPSIKVFLTIDEDNFQIALHYIGLLEVLDRNKFKELLEEFSYSAEEWRYFLDEHDKHDLIYVRAS